MWAGSPHARWRRHRPRRNAGASNPGRPELGVELGVVARGSRRCYKDPRTPIFGALKNSFADPQMWSSLLSWSQDPTDDVVKVLVIGEILKRPFSQDVVRKLGLAITLEPATQQLVVTARCFGRVGF